MTMNELILIDRLQNRRELDGRKMKTMIYKTVRKIAPIFQERRKRRKAIVYNATRRCKVQPTIIPQ